MPTNVSPAKLSPYVLLDGNHPISVDAGAVTRVRPRKGGRYRLMKRLADGTLAPADELAVVVAPADGGDLVVLLGGDTRIVLDDFTTVCQHATCSLEIPGKDGAPASLVDGSTKALATGGDGSQLLYSSASGADFAALTGSYAQYYDVLSAHAASGGGLGASGSKLLAFGGLAAVAGLVAVAAGGGSGGGTQGDGGANGGGGTDTPPPTTQTFTIKALTGPLKSALAFTIFGANGAALTSGVTDDTGTAIITITGYQGPVLVVFADRNGNATDYLDEATNQLASLGTSLRGVFATPKASDVLVVTPITELVVRHMGVTQDTVPSDDAIIAATRAVSTALGIDMAQGAVTVVDAAYHEADGISAAEAYGQMLARFSGLDGKTGSVEATIRLVAAELATVDGRLTLSSAGAALIQQGAAIFESSGNRDAAVLIAKQENLQETGTMKLALQTESGVALDTLLSNGWLNGPLLQQLGQHLRAQVDLPVNAVAGDEIKLSVDGAEVVARKLTLAEIVSGVAILTFETGVFTGKVGDVQISAGFDNGGGSRPSASASVMVDTTPPEPFQLALALDTGTSDADGITSAGAMALTGMLASERWEYTSDGGAHWTSGTGSLGFTLAPGTYTRGQIMVRRYDTAGNFVSASPAPEAITVVPTPPTLTITSDKSVLKVGESADLTLTFSHPPAQLDPGFFTSAAGTLSHLEPTADPLVYHLRFTPADGIEVSEPVIVYADDTYASLPGHLPFTQSVTGPRIDTLPFADFQLSLVLDTGVSATDGITNSGAVVLAGVAQGEPWQYSVDSGQTWTDGTDSLIFTIQPGTYTQSQIVARRVDDAGNITTANLPNSTIQVWDQSPSVAITLSQPSLKAGETAIVTFIFDREVTNFTSDSIAATGGTITGLNKITATVYMAMFTPTEDLNSATGRVAVIMNQYEDLAGNSGLPAQSDGIALDTSAPTVSEIELHSKSDLVHDALNAGDIVTFSVRFSEDVVLASGSTPTLALMVGTQARSAHYAGTSGTDTLLFSYTILAADEDDSGISIGSNALSGQILDLAGNAAVLTHGSLKPFGDTVVDNTAPSPSAPGQGTTFTPDILTLDFDEAVLLASGTITVTDGTDVRTFTLVNGQVSGDGTAVIATDNRLTLTFTTPLTVGNTYAMTISAGALVDASAGNPVAQSTGTLLFEIAPAVPPFVDLQEIGAGNGGYAIDGGANDFRLSGGLAGIGDFNGDGYDDFAFGAASETQLNGAAYIVLGGPNRAGFLTTDTLPGHVIRIAGNYTAEGLGAAISGGGDINGDGRTDILVGISGMDDDTGRTYVVYGKTDVTPVMLSALAKADGFVIFGETASDHSGSSVSAGGDINGDGFDDLLVGAYGNNASAGATYVILGGNTGFFASATRTDVTGTTGDDHLDDGTGASTIVALDGNDNITLLNSGSVAFGGRGDDIFHIGENVLAALTNPSASAPGSVSRIDGGTGINTLHIAADDKTIHLRELVSGSGLVDGDARVENISIIDLDSGSGAYILTIRERDVIALSHADVFRAEGKAQLMVSGGSGDSVYLNTMEHALTLDTQGAYLYGGGVYDVYSNDAVSLFVQQGVHVMMPV